MRKTYSKDIKFKVAIEMVQGDLTIAEIMSRYAAPETLVHRWKKQLLEEGAETFASRRGNGKSRQTETEKLHATIGKLTVENAFLENALARFPRKRDVK